MKILIQNYSNDKVKLEDVAKADYPRRLVRWENEKVKNLMQNLYDKYETEILNTET